MATNSGNAENGAAAPTGYGSLTPREQEIMAKAMTCLKAAPEINFPQLAAILDMKNPRSAVNAWSIIKKKMDWSIKAPSSPSVSKAPAGGKRKKAAATKEEGSGPPAKRAKGTQKPREKLPAASKRGKAAAAPKSPIAAEDDSDEANVKSEDQVDSKDGLEEDEELDVV